jgi:dipeptidyl-peptidase 4
MRVARVFTLAALLFRAAAAIVPARQPHQPTGGGTRLLTYQETTPSAALRTRSRSLRWIGGDEDGQFIYQDSTGLVLESILDGRRDIYVPRIEMPPAIAEYWVREDMKKVLFATNSRKQYRWSYFADYQVLDVASGILAPLVADQAGDIQYAEMAPVGDDIVFVRGNNIYLQKNGTIVQITNDGGQDTFHGVPDWVYEEEVFSSKKTLWFSPDAKYLAYLSFDETGVETYTIPYYMDDGPFAPPYPREIYLRYPKVGSTNPKVSLTLLNLETEEKTPVAIDAFPTADLIVGEVTWVTANHSSLIYRAFNRVQDHEKLVTVDVLTSESKVVRERDGSDGWLDNLGAIVFVGPFSNTSSDDWYLDVSDVSGWLHIYLFSVRGGDGIALTSGEWEVTSVPKVDMKRKLVYFGSTKQHSTEQHLYSVSWETKEIKPIVDDTVSGYWSASFSAGGSYYALSYQGPDVPYQELYAINSTQPLRVLENNDQLLASIQAYSLPNITYFELKHPDGYTLNVMQRLPANFDPSKKYPILFLPYGGPSSQQVTKRFQSLDWDAYISSDPELEYITYTVDGRGTGQKGRAFRAVVVSQLGKLEAEDQIWAAEQLIAKFPFINPEHVVMWGWSFGGYLTAKVIEANSGVFTMGLITAPVSDWRLYDSVYTERYMKTYAMNPAGYNETAVRKADGFKNIAGGFSIFHGTGDDNVHYQNTAALVDFLVGAGVSPEKMKWFSFTDSTHGIDYNGAYPFLFKELTASLYREKQRTNGEMAHQWSRRDTGSKPAVFHFE